MLAAILIDILLTMAHMTFFNFIRENREISKTKATIADKNKENDQMIRNFQRRGNDSRWEKYCKMSTDQCQQTMK